MSAALFRACLLATVVGAAMLPGCKREHDAKPREAKADSPAKSTAPRTIAPPPHQLYSERFRPPEVFCGSDAACLDSPLIASTPKELAWLRAHGYPSFIELRKMRAASMDVLRTEASRGSTAAMVVLGTRLVGMGRNGEGLAQFLRAANGGSIYAYYELSNAHLGPGLADHIDAAAYLRVAYLLGDWKASKEFERRFSAFGPVERVIVDERAASLYRTFAKNRRPEPRPMERE